MAAGSVVHNLTEGAVTLPPPYSAILPAGKSIIIDTDLPDTVIAVLGGVGGMGSVLSVTLCPDTSASGHALRPTAPMPATLVADGFLKRNAANTSWEYAAYGAAGGMAVAGVAAANAAGTADTVARADHVHAMPYAAVQTAIGAAGSALGLNSQKITGLGNASASTDAIAAGQVALGVVTATPGTEAGDAIDVVCSLADVYGVALAATEVCIETVPITNGQGAIAAAGTPVGTLNKVTAALVSSGPDVTGTYTAWMTSTAGGLFSFKVGDTATEGVLVRISAAGCRMKLLKLTFA